MKDEVKTEFVRLSCVAIGCAEIKKTARKVALRNSRKPQGIVEFTRKEWEEFKQAIRDGKV